MDSPGYRKRTIALLFVLLLVRFWLGQTFELTGQEAYLWLLGRGENLDWGYWDKGILVPWLIRLGTCFFGDTELGVRWISAVIYSVTGFLIFWSARRWFSARAAFGAVVVYAVTPLYTWQLLLMDEATSSLGLMMLALVAYREGVDTDKWAWWVAAGTVSGLAVHVSWFNGIWALGLLGYMLSDPVRRHRLLDPKTMLVPGMVAVFSIPIAMWYWRPEAAGLLARLNKVPLMQDRYDFSFLHGLEFIGAQVWLLSPGIFLGIVMAFYLYGRAAFTHSRYSLLLAMSLPGIAVQVFASFWQAEDSTVMPSLYLPALFLAANLWSEISLRERAWRTAGVMIVSLAAVQSVLGLVPPLGPSLGSHLYRPYRIQDATDEVERHKQDQGAAFVIAPDAILASLLTFYLPTQQMAYVAPGTGVRSQFDFWTGYRDSENHRAILVTIRSDPPQILQEQYAVIEPLTDMIVPNGEKAGWRFFFCDEFRKEEGDDSGRPNELIPDAGGMGDGQLPQ
jgi:4-amino-4-deoxy-L-arabinose transferase-like glycosyltransferase